MEDEVIRIKKAEEFKEKGNNLFKENKFSEAIEMYSEATKFGLTGK